jgi:hypothetical protein
MLCQAGGPPDEVISGCYMGAVDDEMDVRIFHFKTQTSPGIGQGNYVPPMFIFSYFTLQMTRCVERRLPFAH